MAQQSRLLSPSSLLALPVRFMWESFQPQFGLPATIGSALVSYSQRGGVEGGGEKPLGAEVQILWVGLHRPPALPRQLLTELLILHIRKLKKMRLRGTEEETYRKASPGFRNASVQINLCLPSRKGSRSRYRDEDRMAKPNAPKYYSPRNTSSRSVGAILPPPQHTTGTSQHLSP